MSGSPASVSAVVSVAISPPIMISCRFASDSRDAEVLLDQQDAQTVLLEPPEHLDQVLDDRRRQALRGLVHDQELRVGQQRASDRQHLLLAARELRATVLAALCETRKQVVDPVRRPAVAAASARSSAGARRRRATGTAAAPAARSRCPSAGDPVGRLAEDLVPEEADRTSCGSLQGRHHAHDRRAERRLPHSVPCPRSRPTRLPSRSRRSAGCAPSRSRRRGRRRREAARIAHESAAWWPLPR